MGRVSSPRSIGLPGGAVVELYGPDRSGKTSFALRALAKAQESGEVAAYVGSARPFDREQALRSGVDLASLVVAQPESGGEAFAIGEKLARSGEVGAMVLDTLEAPAPESVKALAASLARGATVCMVVNRVREMTGLIFGEPSADPGWRALERSAALKIRMRRFSAIAVEEKGWLFRKQRAAKFDIISP